jgi:ribosomal subunit interface protein
MQQPLHITFRGMETSEAVEARVRELAARLERFHDRIVSCHVTIQAPHHHHRQGALYDVRLRIAVPGSEIVVDREGSNNHAHEDPYVAIRDAFDAAVRKLEDTTRKHDHRQRVHAAPTLGKVTRIFPQDGYGFIETSDELEVYFHEHAVLEPSFAQLEVGDEVRLEVAEEEGEKGPQATNVRGIGKRHRR